jgi:hypothetical protein
MNISFGRPPVWNELNAAFGIANLKRGIVFAYVDTVYNPDGVDIPEHLAVHESVHMAQQSNDRTAAGLWYQRYIADPAFRLAQEAEAYGAQYAFICARVARDRNARFRWLHALARDLSGPLYGNMVTLHGAMRAIREAAGSE